MNICILYLSNPIYTDINGLILLIGFKLSDANRKREVEVVSAKANFVERISLTLYRMVHKGRSMKNTELRTDFQKPYALFVSASR